MDPNHWNTYNHQYGHPSTGGLPPTHTSINRFELASGLGLSHGLQTNHSPIAGRTVAAIPSVNYSLGLLDTVSSQQGHKSMSIGQSPIVFDSQLRVAPEQQSPAFGRYESSKPFSREPVSRSQLLDAARMWNSASSIYNCQFLSDITGSSTGTITASPSSGSGGITSKTNQLQLHEPPPAHSSNSSRIAPRSSHASDLMYSRSTEPLIPSSLAQIYSSNMIGKQPLSGNQQPSLHRQTPLHGQQPYTSRSDIEDLSSNSQSQLYGSYGNIAVSDSQDFSSVQLSGDLNYEAVSPAAPMIESSQEHSHFSIVHFPDLANLTSEQAHTLADKFQENDFRLKMDSSRIQHQDVLLSPLQGQRQEFSTSLKIPKDNLQMLSMQINQRNQYQSNLIMSQSMNISQGNMGHSLNQVSQNNSLTTSSMQQPTTPNPIQALADSTTKPKRARNRKKKDPPQSQSPEIEIKKSTAQTMSHHNSNVLNMPPASLISTLPMISHATQASQMQQAGYRNSGSGNQYILRDAHRAQTPSLPQNYSLQDQVYTPSQSPKIPTTPNQNAMRSQGEFALPNRIGNDKSTPGYKQVNHQQRQPESTPKITTCQNSQVYRSNIPDNQQHMQSFASLMASSVQQRGSPMQDNRLSLGRIQTFADQSPQHKIVGQMPQLEQQTHSSDNVNYGSNKTLLAHVSHLGGSQTITMSHSPVDSRPVSVDHGYDPDHQAGLIDTQDTNQYQIDFSGQPFLDQLVGVQPSLTVPVTSYAHSSAEGGEVIFTTLVSPAESARLQQHQHDSTSEDSNFRPTYHGEAVHEIRPIGPIGGHMGMEDVSFNAFFDTQRPLDNEGTMLHQPSSSSSYTPPEPEKMNLTFVPQVVEDDELGYFGMPGVAHPLVMVKKSGDELGPKKDCFQDSFLSYLQGNKQETLSSVSSSTVTKKPQLPKYIPDAWRPRPVVQKESSNFSDSEDTQSLGGRGKELSDNYSSHESDREGYSVQRTSELAVKIKLPKSKKRSKFGPFAESTLLKDSIRKNREGLQKRKRKRSKHKTFPEAGEDFWPGNGSEEDIERVVQPGSIQPLPLPVRTSIGRKAKEKCLEKTTKQKNFSGTGSSTEEDYVPYKSKSGYKSHDSDKNYDSDKDPAWMPFTVDLKQGHDLDEKRKKIRRPRMRTSSIKSSKSSGHCSHRGSTTSVSASSPPTELNHGPSSLSSDAGASFVQEGDSPFQIGMYVIEKKDLQNYESYPIWRLESDNMIRRFEMSVDNGLVYHVAVKTLSAWAKSMESQFELIKVRELPANNSETLRVEVIEEYRPKPPDNRKLELHYEEDPLFEPFKVYIQVFLSQALESSFLETILKTNDLFYVEPLNQIDHMIANKCQEITQFAQWKSSFLECLHRCPELKEMDRFNLKQPCQACENSNPPTIKSILLHGHHYDRCLLTQVIDHTIDNSQEFMIGKVAAHYVRAYHDLYHFKYWLYRHCEAKIKSMQVSSQSEHLSDEVILDKCLENTSWVFQLFDNLKTLINFC